MRKLGPYTPQMRPAFAFLLPIGLWVLVFLGIGPGDPADIIRPGSLFAFFQGLRAVLPIVAAGAAAAIICTGLLQRNNPGVGLLGPLGLATVYGVVGFVAALKSPDGSVALWWTALYLSVPLVLRILN